jgi:hypothetical protein
VTGVTGSTVFAATVKLVLYRTNITNCSTLSDMSIAFCTLDLVRFWQPVSLLPVVLLLVLLLLLLCCCCNNSAAHGQVTASFDTYLY